MVINVNNTVRKSEKKKKKTRHDVTIIVNIAVVLTWSVHIFKYINYTFK